MKRNTIWTTLVEGSREGPTAFHRYYSITPVTAATQGVDLTDCWGIFYCNWIFGYYLLLGQASVFTSFCGLFFRCSQNSNMVPDFDQREKSVLGSKLRPLTPQSLALLSAIDAWESTILFKYHANEIRAFLTFIPFAQVLRRTASSLYCTVCCLKSHRTVKTTKFEKYYQSNGLQKLNVWLNVSWWNTSTNFSDDFDKFQVSIGTWCFVFQIQACSHVLFWSLVAVD